MDAEHKKGGPMLITVRPEDIELLIRDGICEVGQATESGLDVFAVVEDETGAADAEIYGARVGAGAQVGVYIPADALSPKSVAAAREGDEPIAVITPDQIHSLYESPATRDALFGEAGTIVVKAALDN